MSVLRSLLLFLFCAWSLAAHAAGPTPRRVPDSLSQRLLACALCHGQEGRATSAGYFPRIAGKPAGYLYQQLIHFRDGQRQNPGMDGLLDHLSDDYLRQISAHFAQLDLPYPSPQTQAMPASERALAERLVRHGDATRQLPACAACHGAAMTGTLPAIPGLLGLPRDYLIGQLGAWQTGLRHARAPDCMAPIAKALTPTEVGALASWLSSQALPPDSHAVAPGVQPLPLRCGAVERR